MVVTRTLCANAKAVLAPALLPGWRKNVRASAVLVARAASVAEDRDRAERRDSGVGARGEAHSVGIPNRVNHAEKAAALAWRSPFGNGLRARETTYHRLASMASSTWTRLLPKHDAVLFTMLT